jgi:hypothetical protein
MGERYSPILTNTPNLNWGPISTRFRPDFSLTSHAELRAEFVFAVAADGLPQFSELTRIQS